jgi:antitoxin ParD1/3/4
MATMNISIPDDLRDAVEAEVSARGYSTSSEYMRDLIRRDLDRQRIRTLLLEGQQSAPGTQISDTTLESLRRRARKAAGSG